MIMTTFFSLYYVNMIFYDKKLVPIEMIQNFPLYGNLFKIELYFTKYLRILLFSISNWKKYVRKKKKFCTELFSFIGALTMAWQCGSQKMQKKPQSFFDDNDYFHIGTTPAGWRVAAKIQDTKTALSGYLTSNSLLHLSFFKLKLYVFLGLHRN